MLEQYDFSNIANWYVNQHQSATQIAKTLHCHKTTVSLALRRRGITMRNPKQAERGKYLDVDYNLLKTLYIDRQLSMNQIEQELHISSFIIFRALHHYGIPTRESHEAGKLAIKRGTESPNFVGTRRYNTHSYVLIWKPNHPSAKKGWVLEHRYVVEQHIGRLLASTEQIHHLNGIKDDNRIENLELISPANHSLKGAFCKHCNLRKEVKQLHLHIKMLESQIQGKFNGFVDDESYYFDLYIDSIRSEHEWN